MTTLHLPAILRFSITKIIKDRKLTKHQKQINLVKRLEFIASLWFFEIASFPSNQTKGNPFYCKVGVQFWLKPSN